MKETIDCMTICKECCDGCKERCIQECVVKASQGSHHAHELCKGACSDCKDKCHASGHAVKKSSGCKC